MKHLIFKSIIAFLITFNLFAGEKELPKADVDFFREVKNLISEGYVEPVDEETFVYNALNGGLSEMDPHSGYISPKDYLKFKESLNGEFSGIGIQIISENGFIKVISPIDDTPAFKVGIKSGDFITHINGENVYQITTEEASSRMRGKEGTKVKLIILRPGSPEPIELTIKREKIQNKSVSIKKIEDIAIIRISNFTPSTSAELKNILEKEKNIKGLILDLRNNPGGVLDQSIIISNFFLEKDAKIVSVKGRKKEFFKVSAVNGKSQISLGCLKEKEGCTNIGIEQSDEETIFIATANTLISKKIPIITVINKASASASEIVASALQDNKRAITIGEISFGKGVVQTILPIFEGKKGALKLTTSRYYSPNGKAIQTAGITPDIIVFNGKIETRETKLQTLFSQREGDLKNHPVGEKLDEIAKQSEKYEQSKESLKLYHEDLQLLTAINIIKALNFY
jgi:carboxyl-terminal processing protease